jgi:hypothetical protein
MVFCQQPSLCRKWHYDTACCFAGPTRRVHDHGSWYFKASFGFLQHLSISAYADSTLNHVKPSLHSVKLLLVTTFPVKYDETHGANPFCPSHRISRHCGSQSVSGQQCVLHLEASPSVFWCHLLVNKCGLHFGLHHVSPRG